MSMTSLSAEQPAGKRPGAGAIEVIVSLADGEELRGAIQTFNPQLPTFFVYATDPGKQGSPKEVMLDSVKMVSFLRNRALPKKEVLFPASARLVTVRFLDRETIHGVTQSTAGARVGLFLVPTASEDVERIFVPISAIRDVVSVKRLGEILTEKGMVTPEKIEAAIQRQQEIRDEQVGQILLKKEIIDDRQLEKGLSIQKQRPGRRIGDILLEQGFIDRVQLDEALEAQRGQREKKLGEIMVDMGYATYKMIGVALAIQYNVPFMDLSTQTIDPQLRELVPVKTARHWQMLPISLQRGVLTIAIADPTNDAAQERIRRITGLTTICVVSTPQDIFRSLNRFYEP
jgi:hypothetical protein